MLDRSASRTARASWICLRVRPISAAVAAFLIGTVVPATLAAYDFAPLLRCVVKGTTSHSPSLLFLGRIPDGPARHPSHLVP
jgi:hypothetical protein